MIGIESCKREFMEICELFFCLFCFEMEYEL